MERISDEEVTALEHGTIYADPFSAPIRGAALLVAGETIAAIGGEVPASARRIDCTGLTITAGFWNSHVHFFERKWADAASIPDAELARQVEQTFARYGFTTVFDLGSPLSNTHRIRERAAIRILTTGEGLIPPGRSPSDDILRVMGVMKTALFEVADAAQAVEATKALLDAGADGIKLFSVSEEAARAAAGEAHRAGKPVFVHPNTVADVMTALRCGVDVIAHTAPHAGGWQIGETRAALTPTLSLWRWFARHDRLSRQERIVATALEQLRGWPGTVLFGTDLGAVDPDPSEELALMAEAGMSFAQILASLTTAPAALFGGDARLAAGLRADVAVFGDSFADIRYTLRGGRVISINPVASSFARSMRSPGVTNTSSVG